MDKSLNKGMVGSDVFLCFKRSLNTPDKLSYHPGLLDRFPLTSEGTFTLNTDTVAPFCLPLGASIEVWPTSAPAASTIQSTFVLTQQNDEGKDSLYGSALSFYEEYDETLLTEEQKTLLKLDQYKDSSTRRVLTNKCLCLLSKWPFFEAFQKFLFFLYKRLLMGPHDVPLERLISHFLYTVPFPRYWSLLPVL